MALFVWDNSMSVGNEFIDSDHKKLIQVINAFHDAMEEGRGNEVVGKVLNNLIIYTREHFAREEAEMQRIGYPRFLKHRAEHTKLLAEVDALHAGLMTQQMVTLKVSKFLKAWLIDHIQQNDKLLATSLVSPK
jgi:hemerythrin-like metal-binding protein